jgi:PAS domain S-box-containing protein
LDDDNGLVRLVVRTLSQEGFQVDSARTLPDAEGWLAQRTADLMLLDLKLQNHTGESLIDRLKAAKRCPPFIIITGQGDERSAVEMMKRGALDYLVKDGEFLQILPTVVRRAFEELETERRLAAAEEQVRLVRWVVEQGFSAVLISGPELPDPKVIYINPAFAQATGHTPEEVLGQPLSALAATAKLHGCLKAGFPEGVPYVEVLTSYQTPHGERWREWRIGPVKDPAGRVTHRLFISRDVTERKRLEKEILEISDKERRRIGQDLHDGICQHLAGIELMSQALEKKLAPRSKAASARAGEIARHVREAIAQTRSLARGLSPTTLEHEGLEAALKELADTTSALFRVRCRVECSPSAHCLVPAAATHLYRIAQEATSNAIRHGRASEVLLQLACGNDVTRLSITDNGIGCPKELPRQRGMGLRIMQYRVGVMGGTLSIATPSTGGTIVTCSVPNRPDAAPWPVAGSPGTNLCLD